MTSLPQVGPAIPQDGLTALSLEVWSTRWPLNAHKAECVDGCPVWTGGPWDARDVAAAEACFGAGWRAELGEGGYGLALRPALWR